MPRSTRCRPLIQARVCVCVSVCTSFALPNFLISSNRLVGSLWFCGQTTPSSATHEKQKTPTPFQDVCLLSLSSCLMALAIPSGTMLGHHSCDGVALGSKARLPTKSDQQGQPSPTCIDAQLKATQLIVCFSFF